jgi:hypothetical protein
MSLAEECVSGDRRPCVWLEGDFPWWRSSRCRSGLQRAAAFGVAQRWRRRHSSRRLLSLPLPVCGGVVFCWVCCLRGGSVRFGVLLCRCCVELVWCQRVDVPIQPPVVCQPILRSWSCLSLVSSSATITLVGLCVWGCRSLGCLCALYRFQARFSLKLGQFHSS